MRRGGRARGAGKDSGGAAQTRETKGTWLGTKNRAKKANEKIEYGHKCGGAAQRGAGKKRSGPDWQALAERAASEAKFVLIAERKTQEEA